jgi:hypothetical protein
MAKPADQHRKCALVRRTTGRAARGCGLRRAQSRHCLWRDSFVIVDAPTRGFAIRPDEARASLRRRAFASSPPPTSSSASCIPRRAYETISPSVSSRDRSRARGTNFKKCMRYPPRQDRAVPDWDRLLGSSRPCARRLRAEGDVYRARSIIGSKFVGRIARRTTIGPARPLSPLFQAGLGLAA